MLKKSLEMASELLNECCNVKPKVETQEPFGIWANGALIVACSECGRTARSETDTLDLIKKWNKDHA